MTANTIQKYQFGNWDSRLGPPGDFFYGIPARQRELIALTREQIRAQNEASQRIQNSNAEAADMLVREIERGNNSLSEAIASAGASLEYTIGQVGDRVCAELSEIQWELQQQLEISRQILEVLRKPRNTQSQELVRQGVRNYVNGKYQEAEDRFLRAHELDNTDYQVLVNLSYIALHKDNPNAAIGYLKDAVTLPDPLDSAAKADALWSLARVYYTQDNFAECVRYAKESLSYSSSPKKKFQTGVYEVLARDQEAGMNRIMKAIQEDYRLFALALAEPDLTRARSAIENMLAKLSLDALAKSKKLLALVKSQLKEASGKISYEDCRRIIDSVQERVHGIEKVITNSSYSVCVLAASNLQVLNTVISEIGNLNDLYARDTVLDGNYSAAQLKLKDQQSRSEAAAQSASAMSELLSSPLIIIATYIGLGVLLHFMIPKKGPFPDVGGFMGNLGGPIGFLFWPLPFVVLVFLNLLGLVLSPKEASLGWAFGFCIVAGIAIYAITRSIASAKEAGRSRSQKIGVSVETVMRQADGIRTEMTETREKISRTRTKIDELLSKNG